MKPRWRKISETEYLMALPRHWWLRVLFVNDTAWMWELTAGSSIHGIGPCRFSVDEYADADECKAAAVECTRRYFAEMLASVR